MNIIDASSIFNLFQEGKYGTLLDGATIPLAKYEIGNILWKNYKIRNRISKEEAGKSGTILFELPDSKIKEVPYVIQNYLVRRTS